MPPKPSRIEWKSGEQLEFLLSQESSFRRSQDMKTLNHFWPRVFENWYDRWPIVSTPALSKKYGTPEAARIMVQKETNAQIKNWFSTRSSRGAESTKVRGDLKLDVQDKRKLAPVQAFCSYAWASTLRPIVLSRWQQQKGSVTFADDDDPLPDSEAPVEESCIPLAFKLKIAKEVYDGLTQQQKDEIDERREEDQKKRHRKIPEITNNEERREKLQLHLRNQSLVQKSLIRILGNLEDQVGCIAHIFIGSVGPETGRLNVQKFCGGRTKGGVDFETYWGDNWDNTVERKFTEWAARVFGAPGSEQRNQYLLSSDPVTLSGESAFEGNSRDGLTVEVHLATQVPSQDLPVSAALISPASIDPTHGSGTRDLPATEPANPSALESSQPPTQSQHVNELSYIPANSQPTSVSSLAPTEDMTVDARPNSIATPIPPQPPKAPYRVRNPTGVTPGARSRQNSIDGAPEAVFNLGAFSEEQDLFNNNDLEAIVDLREFIDVDTFTSFDRDGETESRISSPQRTSDGSSELLTLSPSPRPRNPIIQTAVDCSQPSPARASPDIGDDYGDLPSWMIKRGQWNYLVSTAGGPIWEDLLRVYMRQERRLEFTETGVTLTTEDRPSKISEYFQYAHKPSRGDTVTVPSFGADVVNWWANIQPEWRRSGRDLPQDPSAWSFILSGGSKGLFLVLMCLSWWHRAHARFLEEENARRIAEATVAGATPNLDSLPTHDPEWLRIVQDVAFVMDKAQGCDIPTRAASIPSRTAKRNRDPAQPNTPRKKRAVNPAPRKTRSRA